MAFNSIYDGIGVNEVTSLAFLLPKFKLVTKLECENASINTSKLKDIFDHLHPLQVFHILKLIEQVAIAKTIDITETDGSVIEDVLDPFIVLVYKIYKQLHPDETHKLLLQLSDKGTTPPCCEGIKVFDYLIDAYKISAENLHALKEFFEENKRKDLLEKIEEFEEKFIHDGVYNWNSKVIDNQHTKTDGKSNTKYKRGTGQIAIRHSRRLVCSITMNFRDVSVSRKHKSAVLVREIDSRTYRVQGEVLIYDEKFEALLTVEQLGVPFPQGITYTIQAVQNCVYYVVVQDKGIAGESFGPFACFFDSMIIDSSQEFTIEWVIKLNENTSLDRHAMSVIFEMQRRSFENVNSCDHLLSMFSQD